MSDVSLGFYGWLEEIFYGGMELSALSTPAFTFLVVLQNLYPDAIPIAGLAAIGTGSVAIAAYRNDVVDVGPWPRRSEFTSLPLRMAYFSLLFFAATIGVAVVAVAVGSWGVAFLGGALVEAIGLAGFPTAYRLLYGSPVRKPAERV